MGADIDVVIFGSGAAGMGAARRLAASGTSALLLEATSRLGGRAWTREVLEAHDGAAGIQMAGEHQPDLILMDIQLPVLDGYEATRRIKSDPALKHIPIIAVTSYALSGDEAKTRAAGCDDYIAKPFSPRQLLVKINSFLRT
jgi:two-component system cell cycle response regulator DivK